MDKKEVKPLWKIFPLLFSSLFFLFLLSFLLLFLLFSFFSFFFLWKEQEKRKIRKKKGEKKKKMKNEKRGKKWKKGGKKIKSGVFHCFVTFLKNLVTLSMILKNYFEDLHKSLTSIFKIMKGTEKGQEKKKGRDFFFWNDFIHDYLCSSSFLANPFSFRILKISSIACRDSGRKSIVKNPWTVL